MTEYIAGIIFGVLMGASIASYATYRITNYYTQKQIQKMLDDLLNDLRKMIQSVIDNERLEMALEIWPEVSERLGIKTVFGQEAQETAKLIDESINFSPATSFTSYEALDFTLVLADSGENSTIIAVIPHSWVAVVLKNRNWQIEDVKQLETQLASFIGLISNSQSSNSVIRTRNHIATLLNEPVIVNDYMVTDATSGGGTISIATTTNHNKALVVYCSMKDISVN